MRSDWPVMLPLPRNRPTTLALAPDADGGAETTSVAEVTVRPENQSFTGEDSAIAPWVAPDHLRSRCLNSQ